MSKRSIVRVILAVGLGLSLSLFADVSERAVAELGSTFGLPQMTGFVFIEGRYLAPPYTVTRRGNGIFINRVFVEAPVPWIATPVAEDDVAVPAAGAAKAVDVDGDFEEEAPAVQQAPVPATKTPDAPKVAKSIDDLFDDDFPDAPAPTARGQGVPATLPVGDDQAGGGSAAKRDKSTTLAQLERIRKGYENALSQGEIFFFGQRHNRINGNYGTARALIGVLPKALRSAQSPQDLLQKLNQGGVYFIDIAICTELFRNKNTFPLLEERLAKIEMTEALEAAKRKPVKGW
jgi:hypothetical protein